jgi:hypothetical protein
MDSDDARPETANRFDAVAQIESNRRGVFSRRVPDQADDVHYRSGRVAPRRLEAAHGGGVPVAPQGDDDRRSRLAAVHNRSAEIHERTAELHESAAALLMDPFDNPGAAERHRREAAQHRAAARLHRRAAENLST